MRGLAATTALVVVLATAATAAAGPRVLFARAYGEADVADEAAAVHLLVRSAFLASDPTSVGDVAGTPTLDGAAQALADADAGHLVLIEVDRLGPTLVATAQIIDDTGAIAGKVASQASDGGVSELASELAREIGKVTGLTVTDPPELSIGQIRPYARAFELAAAGKRVDAARALAGADPVIALRVAAAGAIATALWQDAKLDPAARLIACTVACAPKDVVALTDGDASAAARTARALAAVGLSDAAAAALELTGMPATASADLAHARAAIAHLRQDRKARDAAIVELVAAPTPDRAALAWVAKLPSGVLAPALEVAVVGAGEKVGDRRIAAMIGLRAVEAGAAPERALALISVVELDRSERGRLEAAIEKATGPDALRLIAELAIARGDVAGAKAALAKLKRSTDPRAALYRGRIAWMVGDLDTAADELAAAGVPAEQARVLLAKGDLHDAAKAAGTAETSRLAKVTGAELALADARPTDAVVQLRAAEKLAPGNRDTQVRLANALELSGDVKGAKAVRARLLDLAEPPAPVTAAPTALGSGSGSGSDSDATKPFELSPARARVRATIKDLLAAFPPATLASTTVVLAPIGDEPSGWALKEVDPEPLLHELDAVLDATYQSRVVETSSHRFADKPSAPDLAALAAGASAGTVLLYDVNPDGAVRLVVFDAGTGIAFEQRGTIDVDALEMVHWNVRWLAIPIALITALVGLGLVILVRGWGVIEVKVKRDPNGSGEVLCVELQRTKRRWKIRDLEAFRAATTAAGAKVGRRTARLIGDLTRFRVAPGHWFVHLYGIYDRPGGTRMLDEQHTAETTIERNKSELVEIDLVPRTTELRIKVYDDDKLMGVMVWLDDGPKLYTDARGECVIYAPMGEHTLHVEAKGIKLDRQLSFKTPLVETIEVNLTRERRLAEVSGGLSLQKRAVGEASATREGEAELDLPAEEPLELPGPGETGSPKPVSISKLAAAATLPKPPAATALLPAGVIPVAGPSAVAGLPDLLCGRYRIRKTLGRGAMGVVYRAHDEHLEREVAIKVLAAELRHHPDALRFFTEEAKALAQLNHPNIVSVYDQTTDGDQTYLIMEFVDGRTLDSLLEEKTKVPVHTALALIDQLCTGLAYVHARRVIHRDIKPANIFVSRDRMVKLGDFGLARVMRELSIRKTEIRGTPLYMAPEQITGENVTHRSDLYAVGCTLFELVTGRPPFLDGEILYHHLHTAPPKPSDFEPTLSAAFDQLVLDCIEKEADARIESATAIRDRIRALGTQAAPAPPVAAAAGGT